MEEPTTDYPTPRAALVAGARDALGAPIAVLAAGYVGYGALASGFDFPLLLIVASTLVIWALPGQLIMLEMHAVSAQLVLIVLAVSLSASRFLPMTTVLAAMMRHPRYPSWQMYASAHLLAMTGWVAAINRVPQLPAE
nr:AzlC family ABC transporter permease [bacterium]